MVYHDTTSHSRRVTAIAAELGLAMSLDADRLRDLCAAARRHDSPIPDRGASLDRLLKDLGVRLAGAPSNCGAASPRIEEILVAFHNPRRHRPEDERLVSILRMADLLDERLEWEPHEEALAATEVYGSELVEQGLTLLRASTADELTSAAQKLPVFPRLFLEAVQTLTAGDSEPRDIEKVASRDPVLAGSLLRAANSALEGSRREVRTVLQSITHIGPDLSRRILLATMMRGIFGKPSLRPHWLHAVEAADLAADLAADSKVISPAEASLAALVHDVGLLAIEHLNPEACARRGRLISGGVPARGAEWIVFGFDHAEASTVVLKAWRFPAEVIDAIQNHHTPDRSDAPLASLLYLVEFLTCSEEDYPSAARLEAALSRVPVDRDDLVARRSRNELSKVMV